MERQQQIALQHGKRMGKHAQIRMQKEIIEQWKKEIAEAKKGKNVDEANLPKLEDIEKRYQKEHQLNRAKKNAKYGGKLLKKKAAKQLRHAQRSLERVKSRINKSK